MALWKTAEMTPAINYLDCSNYPCAYAKVGSRIWSPGNDFWKGIFCNGVNLHSERLSLNKPDVAHFYYHAPDDCFYLSYAVDNCYSTIMVMIPVPTALIVYMIGGDGSYSLRRYAEAGGGLQLLYKMCPRGLEAGSYHKIYGTSQTFNTNTIWTFHPYMVTPLSDEWSLSFDLLPNKPSTMGFMAPAHSLVNREDGIVMLSMPGSAEMHFWDINSTPHVYIGKMTAPGVLADVCYEDRQRMWIVTRDGYLQKINYHLMRTELLTEVQERSPEDIHYLIAWDSKRFRLAIFRQRPDAADGSCASFIEFYRPLPKIDLLTDPVPIRPLRYGKHIPFSFHLVGTAGEGISPYMVEAALAAPADGHLERASMGTGQYGIGGVEYVAPDKTCVETLQLKATYTDGDNP